MARFMIVAALLALVVVVSANDLEKQYNARLSGMSAEEGFDAGAKALQLNYLGLQKAYEAFNNAVKKGRDSEGAKQATMNLLNAELDFQSAALGQSGDYLGLENQHLSEIDTYNQVAGTSKDVTLSKEQKQMTAPWDYTAAQMGLYACHLSAEAAIAHYHQAAAQWMTAHFKHMVALQGKDANVAATTGLKANQAYNHLQSTSAKAQAAHLSCWAQSNRFAEFSSKLAELFPAPKAEAEAEAEAGSGSAAPEGSE